MSLLDKSCKSLTIPSESCFRRLFLDCVSLKEVPDLYATELAPFCFFKMFEGCTSLEKAPALPATTLADMNLPDATPEQIMVLANDVARDDESQYSHCEPYDFDAKKIADAIMAVDRHGRRYLHPSKQVKKGSRFTREPFLKHRGIRIGGR